MRSHKIFPNAYIFIFERMYNQNGAIPDGRLLEDTLFRKSYIGFGLQYSLNELAATEPEEPINVVREKRFAVKPCSTEEAILQMDLLGHSFFLYRSTENDQIQAVYRRADGGYGVLIPEG